MSKYRNDDVDQTIYDGDMGVYDFVMNDGTVWESDPRKWPNEEDIERAASDEWFFYNEDNFQMALEVATCTNDDDAEG